MIRKDNYVFDKNNLLKLGFSKNEILYYERLINDIEQGKYLNIQYARTENQYNKAIDKLDYVPDITNSILAQLGLTNAQSERIKYIHAICTGRVHINNKESYIKHLKKMFGKNYKIGIQDLLTSRVSDIPRNAVVSGINVKPFDIWNSKRYTGVERFFKVISVSGSNIKVETAIKPLIKYGGDKEVPNMLKILELTDNGNVIVNFNKNYCRLCNRFIIVASFRLPEFHLGCYELIGFEGTKIYVYAKSIGIKDSAKYNNNTERVYDYGYYGMEINPKLTKVAKEMYAKLRCVSKDFYKANMDFTVLARDIEQVEETDGVIE